MAGENSVSNGLQTVDPMTDAEWKVLRSQMKGGFIPISPASYLKILTYATSFAQIKDFTDSISQYFEPPEPYPGILATKESNMPRFRLPSPTPKAVPKFSAKTQKVKVQLDKAGKVVVAAGKVVGKSVAGTSLAFGTWDALSAWSDNNPETKALIEIALDRGGLLWDELMQTEQGREVLIREADKAGAPVHGTVQQDGTVLEDAIDEYSEYSDVIPLNQEAAWLRDSKNEEILDVLHALNITSLEYITLLRSVRNHSAEDVVGFQRTRQQYGLQRM